MSFRKPLVRCFVWVLYVCATLQFVRFYIVGTTFYLNMPRYLAGKERLPFQERILPIFLMWPINHATGWMRALEHPEGGFDAPSAATHQTVAFYILSLVSFAAASYFTLQLYKAVTRTGTLSILVFPVFIVLTLWTYVVHIDADFSFPYDLPSLAFFSGGLLAIYKRQFLPLLLVIVIGTMNRETTVFLVVLYIIDAASRVMPERSATSGLSLRERFSFAQIPLLRTFLLFACWLSVRLIIHRHFAHNDPSESYVRLRENISRLQPRLWPILLNICGYVLPVVLVFNRNIKPARFRNYFLIVPLWFAVMFWSGVILETRIFGELCSLTAVAAVLLLEEHIAEKTSSLAAAGQAKASRGAESHA